MQTTTLTSRVERIEAAAPAIAHVNWFTSIPFIFVHLVAIAGLFYFPVTWKGIALCVGLYYFRMWGLTTGYHRYFSHRSFKTGRVFQFILALVGTLNTQKGVLWWAANHRHHHRYSDMPEDVHSPVQGGFWWSQVVWILTDRYGETMHNEIRDFSQYPELNWLNRHYLVPVFAMIGALFALGGLSAVFWGFFMSTTLLWHGTSLVNSATHIWGSRRYQTTDQSRNNWWVALLTMGEGWHNNHHHYMNSARQGFFWWEIDMSYYILKALETLGIVWDVRQPPARLLEKA